MLRGEEVEEWGGDVSGASALALLSHWFLTGLPASCPHLSSLHFPVGWDSDCHRLCR